MAHLDEVKHQLHIRPLSFAEVLPVWQQQLWPGRESKIEPTSAIAPDGTIDMNWMNAGAFFWGLFDSDRLVGTQSLLVLNDFARLRGLWIHPDYRGQGYAKYLMATTLSDPRVSHCNVIWTMARKDSSAVYKSLGLVVDRQIDAYEFGPHLIMKLDRRIFAER